MNIDHLKKGIAMKKLILALALLLVSARVFAAGTCVPSYSDAGSVFTISYACTADAAAATYPSTTLDANVMASLKKRGFYLYEVYTSPGATAPTDETDFTLADSNGLDILGTAGLNKIDATSDLRFFPKNSAGGYSFPAITGTAYTMAISNNAVNSAVTAITFVFVK